MHLKSLTLRGFKSFATSTTLRFEPGITCVVGPNGSGKSNVVDAIAWVLGEQGAKSLRGGKMEDVIFAGTPGRPALGRAEVILTIDNSDGALPIEYAEVTISRLMFRSGESEYAINGSRCRLVDVQELLSDSGIGRELHVIVGQGQLDAVLSARPEDRRGFIEEAAGILKHRKRKEKALRKLDAMQANLTRLTDLTGELRRQLKPLGKQAEVAKRAADIQAQLRDSRLRIAADDLLALRSVLEAELRDEDAVRTRRTAVEHALADAETREGELEEAVAANAPMLARAQECYYRLASLRERFRGTASLAGERQRHLSENLEAQTREGRSAEDLEREAAEVRGQEVAVRATLIEGIAALRAATERRQGLEIALHEEERRLVTAVRAQADRREGLARLTGEVGALRSRSAAAEQEIGRLQAAIRAAASRAETSRAEFDALQAQISEVERGELGLDERYELLCDHVAQATTLVESLLTQDRDAEKERAFWSARCDALEMSLARKDGGGALLSAGDRLPGLLGTVASLLSVEPGFEAAVAAALGSLADVVAVASTHDAVAALSLLKADDAGRAQLLVGGSDEFDRSTVALPDGARWSLDVVDAPAPIAGAVGRVLGRVVVVPDLGLAEAVVRADTSLTAVTVLGDVLAGHYAAGGSASAPSTIEIHAAAEEARSKVGEATRRVERLRFSLASARTQVDRLQTEADDVLGSLHDSDARMAGVAEQLGQLGSAQRAASEEAARLQRALADAETARDGDLEGLSALESRLSVAEATPDDTEPSTDDRDRVAGELTEVRAAEVDARMAVVAAEERSAALAARADSLESEARAERAARERFAARRDRRARGAVVAAAVAIAATDALARVEGSIAAAAAERESVEQTRRDQDAALIGVRSRRRELAAEVDSLTDVAHRDELTRAEQRMRIETLEGRCADDFGIPAETVLAEYGPSAPMPGDDGEETIPYDRAVAEKRAASADRQLALLGRINPLALEEFAALEERHAFLSSQLDDLRDTRRDLLTVVKEVDERIHDVFVSAFEDTAREFEQVFAALFPGGEGRLVLTDPDNMLTTGIEVEARPPGKKVKRLSLLSGGERSLTAIALLVAIFRARPSPFYILDEVEAALDDHNLGRLLEIMDQLRESSQLIVITHQKRTMEVADALYGVSMRGDGISTVISQRLRDREEASA
ncbi:MAG: chromosome segregation protein SMC [Actinomycetota bacterium]